MGVTDFLFVGNRVQKCDKLDDYLGVGWTGAIMGNGSISSYPLHQNLRIISNTFVNFPRRSLVVESASNVEISGNVFVNDEANEPQTAERGQMLIERSDSVFVNGNSWRTSQFTTTRELVSVDAGTTRNVTRNGNAVVA